MSDEPRDPSGIDEPHDILAAEEFEIGTRDERHPPDPSGIEEPHDVLAAEEFAMPVGEAVGGRQSADGGSPTAWLAAVAIVVLGLLLWRRR